jgi:hypothetical protein
VTEATLPEVRIVPETEDFEIAKPGDVTHHWAVFRNGEDWAPVGLYPTEADARAAANSLAA